MTIKIGYKNYEIHKLTEVFDDKHQELYGEINYNKEEIRISTKFSDNLQRQSLIHEIVHAIADKYQLEMNKDERTVDLLAAGIYELILDNKEKVIEFINGVSREE